MTADKAMQAAPDCRPPADEIAAPFRTKADKIRALSKAGYSRAEIARHLNVRYQHVRNVLVDEERLTGRTTTRVSSDAVRHAQESQHLYPTKTRLETDGRVAIPQEFWRAAGLEENDSVMVSIEGEVICLMSLPASIRRAQEYVRRLVPEGVSLVDELLAERRDEARREDDDV
jgi:bifunctional DNA-binding transcriptional regulator/antitoxin component of YhaV-PrlF toxin-antitoxin module